MASLLILRCTSRLSSIFSLINSSVCLSQFCVSVSGFRVNDPLASDIFGQSYATPTLHVIGKTDVIVVEERSKVLLDVSANARVEEHEGGGCDLVSFGYPSRVCRSFRAIESELAELFQGLSTQSIGRCAISSLRSHIAVQLWNCHSDHTRV